MAKPRSDSHLALGRAIREVRAEQGVAQDRLAARAGLDRAYVGGIERGERNPSYTSLLRLVDALEIKLSDLILRAERHESTR